MSEYIEREALLNTLCNDCCHRLFESTGGCNNCYFAEMILEAEPAADVVPVRHGRWLCVDTDTEQFFLCDRCEKREYWESNYCPNCGARMDGGTDHA